MLKRNGYLFVSLLTLLIFFVLFFLRSLDDNRITSWEWIFDGKSAAIVFFILAAGVILLIPLSKISFPFGNPTIFLFASAFIAIVPFWSEPEIIVDASRYFTQAKYLEIYGISYFFKEWGGAIAPWTDLPLMPFLYGLIFRTAGESRLCIQVFTTFLFSATVVVTYLTGKELWDKETGFKGGLLLLGFPYLMVQVPLMLVDVPTMFFLILAIFAFIRTLNGKGTASVIFGGVCISLAALSKYSTWPMLSVLIVILMVCRKWRSEVSVWRRMIRGALALLTALLIMGVIIYLKFDVIWPQIKLLMSYQKPGLKRWGESFVSTFFFQIHPFVTISAMISVWMAFRKRDGNYLIIGWLPALMLIFQIKRIRYVLPLFPMFALMASYGLRRIRAEEIKRFIVMCTLLSSIATAFVAYLPFARKMSAINLKDAGAFLDTLGETDIEVFALPQKEPVMNPAMAVPLLDLYTKKRIFYHYDPSLVTVPEGYMESALRFTWEFRNPEYYNEYHDSGESNAGAHLSARPSPVVVITGESQENLPPYIASRIKDYRKVREFKIDEGVFQYKTFVSVYQR